MGFPIRRFLDQSLFAAPQNFSQRTTSFIASQCQGIHRMPLRRLIALIVDTHLSNRSAIGKQEAQSVRQTFPQRGKCPPDHTALPSNTTRKTILLHHSSSASTPQDKALNAVGRTPHAIPFRMPHADRPGDLHTVPADGMQPDECLFTMSNNARISGRNGCNTLFQPKNPGKTSFLPDKFFSLQPHQTMVEPDGIEPTTS